MPSVNLRNIAAAAIMTVGLSGCATISEKSCAYDSWYDVGFRGAMENKDRADYLDDILRDCGKHGFEPDQGELARGFEEGTAQFCLPDNGFAWGRKGRSYNGICRASEFANAYSDGYRIYQVEQRRSTIVSRLSSIRSELESLEEQLDEAELSDEDRRKAERSHARLLREREDLNRELKSLPRF